MRTAKVNGYSVVELMVGLAVMAVLMYMSTAVFTSVHKQTVDLTHNLEGEIDRTVGERIIQNDLRGATASFNIVSAADDNGRNFFDLDPEQPNSTSTDYARQITLSPGQNEFFLLVQNNKDPVLIYDPPAAYKIGAAPNDFNQPASLDFQSLNNNGFVSAKRNFWNDGRLVLLDTPVLLRPSVGGVVDTSKMPRSPVYICEVSGQDCVTPAYLDKRAIMIEPTTERPLTSADLFLRLLPPVGGALPLVRMKSVVARRYVVERKVAPSAKKPIGKLMRYTYADGKSDAGFLVADDVEQVFFQRPNLTEKLIYFKIKRQSKNDK